MKMHAAEYITALHKNGYVSFKLDGRHVFSSEWAAPAIREALAKPTLYEWAESQHPHETFQGRGIAYGVALPSGTTELAATPVVVRRSRHGGMFRFITREYFLAPTRAPLELEISLRLRSSGVPTPEVIAIAIYPYAVFWAKSDVMTSRLPVGADFPAAWQSADSSTREIMLRETVKLLHAMAKAGAQHPDLNVKNIYLAGNGPETKAYLLDVDRVIFSGGNDVTRLNFKRLVRSINKWRRRWGFDFSAEDLMLLEHMTLEDKG